MSSSAATPTSCGARAAPIFGEPELGDDPEIDTMAKRFDDATYQRRVKPIIERWFANRTKAELEAMAGDRIALTPIKRIDEVVTDAHLRARADVRAGAVRRASASKCSARR